MGTIYKIENIINSKCYYGQTIHKAAKRRYDHFNALKRRKHKNKHLQSSWDKYGEEAFRFTIISETEADTQLDHIESRLIEVFQTMNPKYGYNKESGGNRNKRASKETRQRNSQTQLIYFKNGGIAHQCKPVIGPDGFMYPSLTYAALAHKCAVSTLSESLKNNKPCKGMIFSYLN
jgi:group I intron endonuclease